MLSLKGLEVEMYTGTPDGEIVGFSDVVARTLEGFDKEPDTRNSEYVTTPCRSYQELTCKTLQPRFRLRKFLKTLGDYTLLPGSTLSTGNSQEFHRSDPDNPYHSFIAQTYGTKVVTASIHINIGIEEVEQLMRAVRLATLEAPLFLALSAASPFLDNEVTGYHSTRWQIFPKSHSFAPLFASHQHYIGWVNEQLKRGTMHNVRHLWLSTRPNGPERPYRLNRLELRICDLVSNPLHIVALTAFLEARIWQILQDPELDPLTRGCFSPEELRQINQKNEEMASKSSLESHLHHWQTGRLVLAKDWIWELYQQVYPIAQQQGFAEFLTPLLEILEEGNEAQKWLQMYEQGESVKEILAEGSRQMVEKEKELEALFCRPLFSKVF